MVDVLLRIHVAEATLSKETSPDHAPGRVCHVAEASHFESVDDAVVGVGALRDFEAGCTVGLQLILGVLDYSGVITRQVALLSQERWVREKNVGLARGERTFDHGDNLIGRSSQKLISNSILALLLSHMRHRLRDLLCRG